MITRRGRIVRARPIAFDRVNFGRRELRIMRLWFGLLFTLLFSFLSLFPLVANAETLFDGQYKVLQNDKHVGYLLQRYTFDKNKKTFSMVYFLKTNKQGGDITESLKATCKDTFAPISYQYTSQTGGKIKLIDAEVKGKKIHGTITEGKKKIQVTNDLSEGVFLSSFLSYLMLQNGLKVGKNFSYNAIAEEDLATLKGEAKIEGEEKQQEQNTFRIKNTFKDATFVAFVTAKGEVLKTESKDLGLATVRVASVEEATKGQHVPKQIIKNLFN